MFGEREKALQIISGERNGRGILERVKLERITPPEIFIDYEFCAKLTIIDKRQRVYRTGLDTEQF